jgi:hypothetical protein
MGDLEVPLLLSRPKGLVKIFGISPDSDATHKKVSRACAEHAVRSGLLCSVERAKWNRHCWSHQPLRHVPAPTRPTHPPTLPCSHPPPPAPRHATSAAHDARAARMHPVNAGTHTRTCSLTRALVWEQREYQYWCVAVQCLCGEVCDQLTVRCLLTLLCGPLIRLDPTATGVGIIDSGQGARDNPSAVQAGALTRRHLPEAKEKGMTHSLPHTLTHAHPASRPLESPTH